MTSLQAGRTQEKQRVWCGTPEQICMLHELLNVIRDQQKIPIVTYLAFSLPALLLGQSTDDRIRPLVRR